MAPSELDEAEVGAHLVGSLGLVGAVGAGGLGFRGGEI